MKKEIRQPNPNIIRMDNLLVPGRGSALLAATLDPMNRPNLNFLILNLQLQLMQKIGFWNGQKLIDKNGCLLHRQMNN